MSKILFEKPVVDDLKAQGYTCVDMHLHTDCSDDAVFACVKKTLKRAKKLGIGIAITDHNKIDGAMYACEHSDGVLVIPGIEVKSYTGVDHLLYFYEASDLKKFFDQELKPHLEVNPFVSRLSDQEIVDAAKKYNCVIGAAHPFIFRCLGLPGIIKTGIISQDVLGDVEYIEVLNREMSRKVNEKAIDWAHSLEKVQIAGSDAHSYFHVGTALTCVKTQEGEHVLDALKRKDTLLVGLERNAFTSAISFVLGQFKLITRKKGIRMLCEFLLISLSLKRRKKK